MPPPVTRNRRWVALCVLILGTGSLHGCFLDDFRWREYQTKAPLLHQKGLINHSLVLEVGQQVLQDLLAHLGVSHLSSPEDDGHLDLVSFGKEALKITGSPEHRHQRLRGIYVKVVEPGEIAVGDEVAVLSRGA